MSTQPNRKLQYGEKILLFVSLLAVILLVALGMKRPTRPTYAADIATPETACKSLVKALLNQNQAEAQRLTTAHGYAVLQGYLKTKQFNSYPALAHRIMAEWGNTAFWDDGTVPEDQAAWGLTTTVKPGEKAPDIMFKRTPAGWKLNNYVPEPDRLAQRPRHVGQMWNLGP